MARVDDEMVKRFAMLFAGRTDAAGRLRPNGTSYQEKLPGGDMTPQYRAHMEGQRWPGCSLGVYPLTDDGMVLWGACDVDLGDEASAWAIATAMESHGARPFVEVSKSKGHHVWVFVDLPVPGYAMRAFLRRCASEAGVGCETFPKQDTVSAANPYGNFIHLPYCGHPEATGGRYIIMRDGRQLTLGEFLDRAESSTLPDWAMTKPVARQQHADRMTRGEWHGGIPACIEACLRGSVPEGQRNEALCRVAAHLVNTAGQPDGEQVARAAAIGWGMPEREAERTIRSMVESRRWYGCSGKREVPYLAAACNWEACAFHRSPERQQATFRLVAAPPVPPPATTPTSDTTALSEEALIELVAPHGFLRHYVDYCTPLSDAPPMGHLAAALALVAAALGNHVYMRGFMSSWLRPNVWVVFIAESGARKSSVMQKAISMLLQMEEGKTRLLSNKASLEAWLDELMRYPSRLLHADEFLALYRRFERDNMAEARSDFTSLFATSRHVYTTLTRGIQVIENPALSILSGCTPDELARHVKREHFSAGFLSRFLWLPARREAASPAEIPVVDPRREQALVQRLNWINSLTGEVTFDRAINRRLAGWSAEFRRLERDNAGAGIGLVNRAFDFAGKFAMIMQVAETEPGAGLWRDLDPDVVERAIMLTEWLIRSTLDFINRQLLDSDFERDVQRLIDIITGAGGVLSRQETTRKLRLDPRRRGDVLRHALDAGLIEQGELETTGRTAVVYRLAQDTPPSDTSHHLPTTFLHGLDWASG